MRPTLVTETSDSFKVQLLLAINATLNSTHVDAFEQATADWLDNIVMEDGSLSMVQVTVTEQKLKPVDSGPTAASEGNGGGERNRHRNLQEQQDQPQQQVYLEIEMDVDAMYSGPDANFDLYKALDPLIQAHDDDWMRNLANAAPTVFESLRPASMAAIFGHDQPVTVSSGMSTGGYVAIIIVSLMALSLGVAASIFVVKAHQRGDLLSAKSLPSPGPSSYNMSMEEYPLNASTTENKPSMPVPPVSEQSENSPLRGGEVASSPTSSCSVAATLEYLGCGGTRDDNDEEEEERDMENTPPVSPNTMEKGRDNHKKVALGGNNRAAAAVGINLFDGIPFRKPSSPDDGSRQDPPSFSEVDFGADNRSLFDHAVANKFPLLASSHNVPPPSTLHAHAPRDPSDRGISKMLHRHPDPITSSSFNPMVSTKCITY